MGCLVTILALLTIFGGLFSILWGLALTGFGGITWLFGGLTFADTIRGWGGNEFWGGLLNLVVGVIQIIAGFGLLFRAGWAWLVAVITAVYAVITSILTLINGDLLSIFGLVIPGIVLVILSSGNVRRQFGRA
jgi:hypothetical protein